MASALINNTIQVFFVQFWEWTTRGWSLCSKPFWHLDSMGFWDVPRPNTKPLYCSSSTTLQSGMVWLLVQYKGNQSQFQKNCLLELLSCRWKERTRCGGCCRAIEAKTTADDVDKIIDQIITETAQMETDMEEPSVTRSDDIVVEGTTRSSAVNDEDDNLDGAENEIARKMASFNAPKQFLKEPLRSGEDDDMSGSKQPSKIIEPAAAEKEMDIEPVATEDLSLAKSVAMMTDSEEAESLSKALALTEKPSQTDEESMSLEDILKQIPEDMMLPSVTAAEITRIKFGFGIDILGVSEGDWYKASLPQIDISDKGKAPLVEKDDNKGHPAREMFSLICADIDFLVHLREKVIADVVSFFHSFSLSRLAVLGSVKAIVSKEEQMLTYRVKASDLRVFRFDSEAPVTDSDFIKFQYYEKSSKVFRCDRALTVQKGDISDVITLRLRRFPLAIHKGKESSIRISVLQQINKRPLSSNLTPPPPPVHAAAASSPEFVPTKFDEENPSAPTSSGLIVQADEGVSHSVVDLIDDIYRRLP
ncbi:splicing factor 3B subunit 1-like [Dorcoceras hygrometricum]|uniref:Splicing factor 3B subunit 1-like n=1 Tax=Dorcoceras hygrometricum TaxID=472368 RepID=A0A2Z7CTI6_9LAMI|nr:splicing factor 3B subunit 1-like [Dorcoceras hygrometricum]